MPVSAECNNIGLTDSIVTDKATLSTLGERIIDNKENIIHIPADIFISDKIPLPNIEIIIDDIFNDIKRKIYAEFKINNNRMKVDDGELVWSFSIKVYIRSPQTNPSIQKKRKKQ